MPKKYSINIILVIPNIGSIKAMNNGIIKNILVSRLNYLFFLFDIIFKLTIICKYEEILQGCRT